MCLCYIHNFTYVMYMISLNYVSELKDLSLCFCFTLDPNSGPLGVSLAFV